VIFLEVEYEVKIVFRGREVDVNALLSEKVWFTVMSEKLFLEKFGPVWMSLKKPNLFVIKDKKINVDKFATVGIKIGSRAYKETVYISDDLINVLEKDIDLIIGKKFLERNKIRIMA